MSSSVDTSLLSESTTVQDYTFKIVITGSSTVGKSQLHARFSLGDFTEDSVTTIGVEYQQRLVQVGEQMIKC